MIDQAVAELQALVGVRGACAAVCEARARWYAVPPPKPATATPSACRHPSHERCRRRAHGDPAAEPWVATHAVRILAGEVDAVIAALQTHAADAGLPPRRRGGVYACIGYLQAKQELLRYDTALQAGWPIATGVIEGACRHLVGDRLDITGARWGIQGAEAVLKLRTRWTNGDLPAYWAFHLAQEHRRVHQARYQHPPTRAA